VEDFGEFTRSMALEDGQLGRHRGMLASLLSHEAGVKFRPFFFAELLLGIVQALLSDFAFELQEIHRAGGRLGTSLLNSLLLGLAGLTLLALRLRLTLGLPLRLGLTLAILILTRPFLGRRQLDISGRHVRRAFGRSRLQRFVA